VGEGTLNWDMVDYGWLENARGDTLYNGGKILNTFHLNGDIKNRIALGTIKLPAGKYRLRYKSDDSHSYSRFNTEAPVDSQFWGVQVARISSTESRTFAALLKKQNEKSYIYGTQINVIEYGSKGIVWLGTTRGLSKFELKSKEITNYRHDKNNLQTISNDLITDIHQDRDGIIWLTTESGLNRFDPENKKFNAYFEKDGLPSAQLMSLEEDEDGNLWIGSINGICRMEKGKDGSKPIFINYDTKDGLQGYIFFNHSSHINTEGELFFGGRNGLNAFYPGKTNINPADIVISEFFISNQSVKPSNDDSPLTQHILDTENMVLNYDQNDLSFEIASLHFARPERNSLSYKLEGFNNDWVQNPHRFISFTNLGSGEYRFRVRGANSDGIKSTRERVIAITVLPPWWQTTWAYIMYVFLLAGVIFTVDRVQRYRLTQRERNRSQIREAELRAQAAEAHAKMVEAENKRKTLELEEARKLQISMLPTKLPQLPHLNIAVFMQTATEVGGDYYDFHVHLDGTLTVVIGDATGHGMKAGTMVTTAKSLFNSYAPNPDIQFSFREITRCIKQMNLDKLSMCMTMLKIKDDNLLMSSAGMPPIFLYRREGLVIEEHLIQGMPLGSMEKFPYEVKETTLAPGDTIMLMSDGLAELQNENHEQFGYSNVRNSFESVADKDPEDIINHLKNEGLSWLGTNKPDDDITFVVIQVEK
jgi:serine phosphatase RsbU (regulator of sigma subunit)